MSLSTDGFTYLGTLKVPSVVGSEPDLPLYIKYEDFTSTMLASLDSGGGDLRISSDLAGDTQLALDVVTFTKATGDEVWCKAPNVATDALLYVWGNKTGESQPLVAEPFGRNECHSGSKLRAHLGSSVFDSTGNNSLNFDNSVEVAGQIGSGRDYNGSSQYGRFNTSGANSNLGGLGKSSVWFKPDASQSGKALICFDKTNSSNYKHLLYITSSSQNVAAYVRLTNGTVYAASYATGAPLTSWHRLAMTYDRSLSTERLKVYFDGVVVATNDCADFDVGTNTDGVSLARWGGTTSYGGKIDEYDLSTDVSADRELIEYQNQSSVGAWFIAEDAGAGGGSQIIDAVVGQQLNEGGSLSLSQLESLVSVLGQQLNEGGSLSLSQLESLVSVLGQQLNEGGSLSLSQLESLVSVLGQQLNESPVMIIEVLGSQTISSIVGQQLNEGGSLSLSQLESLVSVLGQQLNEGGSLSLSQLESLVSVLGQQLNQSPVMVISTLGSQTITVVTGQQLNQGGVLGLNQLESLVSVLGQQLNDGGVIDLTQTEVVNAIVGQQFNQGSVIDLSQFESLLSVLGQQLNEGLTVNILMGDETLTLGKDYLFFLKRNTDEYTLKRTTKEFFLKRITR